MDKFPFHFRKSHCGFLPIQGFGRAAFAAAVVVAISFTSDTNAQCPGGAAPDALGCPTKPEPSAQRQSSAASISIEEPDPMPRTMDSPVDTIEEHSGLEETRRIKERERRNAPTNPEPLTEFQRFVAASTGTALSVYGANLFSSVPTSFAPLEVGPVPGEMIVDTDDELRIRVWGQVNLSANLRVSREGEIYIPKVGAVHVAGLPFSEVQGQLGIGSLA